MIQKLGRTNYQIFAMDVESHNDPESIAKQETSIWLGCLLDENLTKDDPNSYFYTIDEFLDRIIDFSKPRRKTAHGTRLCKNVCVYIYNLSFEWSFILPKLLERGFEFAPIINKESGMVYNSISTKSVSSVWEVTIKASPKFGFIRFRDLAKIFGGGLGKVAKSFNLPTQKGEIDYRKNRLHNYQITQEEKEYCFNDTRIIIDILLEMQRRNDKDFWKSLSMSSYSMRKLIQWGYKRALKPYLQFRKGYPELGAEETKFLRQSVEGGLCYANPRYQFKELDCKIGHIDARQMHPSSAYLYPYPYGEGEFFTGAPKMGRISCCRIRISYDDVKLYSNIKLIGCPFIEDREIVVWDFEIPIMQQCYENLKVEFIDGYAYKFKMLPWRGYYKYNFDSREQAKIDKDNFLIMLYKGLNNGSYGKLLEKPHNTTFANIVNPSGIIDSIVIDKEEILVNAKYTYLPVGSAIPARSRCRLIELALKYKPENVLYVDTDSIFFIWNAWTKKVWETETNQKKELGGWGWEEMIDKAQFTAPKRYKLISDNIATIKAGGINFDKFKEDTHTDEYLELLDQGLSHKEALSFIKLNYNEVNIISSSYKVQRAYRVKGGTIIEFQEKKVGVQEKYQSILEKNNPL